MSDNDERPGLLNRREAILRVSAMLGGVALVGQSAMLTACSGSESEVESETPPTNAGLFSADEVAFLDEIADTIVPETDTPGAKAAAVGTFMASMVVEMYNEDQQRIFKDGVSTVDVRSRDAFGNDFLSLAADERLKVLETLDVEQHEHMRNRGDKPIHFFRMMKELALLGYFTSEIGCTQALRYIEAPGRYDPCAPYEPGDKAWVRPF